MWWYTTAKNTSQHNKILLYPKALVWYPSMAAISLFKDTHTAALMSFENAQNLISFHTLKFIRGKGNR